MIAFILILSSLFAPRAVAKFCVNEVVHNDDIPKVQKHSARRGCPQLTVTRVDDDFSHVYSVVVYVGE